MKASTTNVHRREMLYITQESGGTCDEMKEVLHRLIDYYSHSSYPAKNRHLEICLHGFMGRNKDTCLFWEKFWRHSLWPLYHCVSFCVQFLNLWIIWNLIAEQWSIEMMLKKTSFTFTLKTWPYLQVMLASSSLQDQNSKHLFLSYTHAVRNQYIDVSTKRDKRC